MESNTDHEGAAIWCRRLRKRYGRLQAVDGIDLAIPPGECFGLLGPNGAGKTTTVEILEGLRPADSGEVVLLGERWGSGRDERLRKRLGVQLQETQLPERQSVAETVRLFQSFYPHGRGLDEVLDLLDLQPKRRALVGTLSGGQKQRLALACALVSDPEILFLDEPTTGLDPQARLRIWAVVEDFRRQGGTILLTTHAMEEAARLCDRVGIVDQGKMIALGSPAELIRTRGAAQVVACTPLGALDEARLASLPGVGAVSRRGERLLLTVDGIGEALPALLGELERQQVRLTELSTHEATLEDVFVQLTGRGLRDG